MDGDTSTNDCVIGLASGASGAPLISDAASPEAQQLEAAVTALLQGMAKSIAWDGEGATCLIQCDVIGAASDADANQVNSASSHKPPSDAAVIRGPCGRQGSRAVELWHRQAALNC